MHAPSKPRAVAVSHQESLPMLVRGLIAIVATATLLFLFTPSVIHAQDKPGSHTVVAGESLWSLASQFFGDGQKWRELATLNSLGANGEKQLVVGQVIKVPEHKPAATGKVAATPPANTPHNALMRALQPQKTASTPAANAPAAAQSSAPGALASQTASKGDAAAKPAASAPAKSSAKPGTTAPSSTKTKNATAANAASTRPVPDLKVTPANAAPVVAEAPIEARAVLGLDAVGTASTHIWSPDLTSQREARGAEPTTVFLGRVYDAVETENAVKALITVNRIRPRSAEYASAPYAVPAGSMLKGGLVGRRSGAAAGAFRAVERLVMVDEAEVTLPAGVAPVVGARFVSVEDGGLLKTGVRVAVPTGVFEVVKVEAGRPVIARVVQQSGRIQEGQLLLPLEGGPASNVPAKSIARAAGVPETEVVWVESALLPSLESFLLLGAGERDGVKAGDEYALVTRMGLGADAQEARIALVRVVRVTAHGSTAIVVRQDQPRIAVGGAARLVARVE